MKSPLIQYPVYTLSFYSLVKPGSYGLSSPRPPAPSSPMRFSPFNEPHDTSASFAPETAVS